MIAIEDVETLARIHRLYKGSGGDQATGNGKRYIRSHSLMTKEWPITAKSAHLPSEFRDGLRINVPPDDTED